MADGQTLKVGVPTVGNPDSPISLESRWVWHVRYAKQPLRSPPKGSRWGAECLDASEPGSLFSTVRCEYEGDAKRLHAVLMEPFRSLPIIRDEKPGEDINAALKQRIRQLEATCDQLAGERDYWMKS